MFPPLSMQWWHDLVLSQSWGQALVVEPNLRQVVFCQTWDSLGLREQQGFVGPPFFCSTAAWIPARWNNSWLTWTVFVKRADRCQRSDAPQSGHSLVLSPYIYPEVLHACELLAAAASSPDLLRSLGASAAARCHLWAASQTGCSAAIGHRRHLEQNWNKRCRWMKNQCAHFLLTPCVCGASGVKRYRQIIKRNDHKYTFITDILNHK